MNLSCKDVKFMAKTLDEYFIEVLNESIEKLKKSDDPSTALLRALKRGQFLLKDEIEFGIQASKELKELLVRLVDVVFEVNVKRVERVCNE